jgi:deazaflavin-dependent oxidoreductase (nitroreductase family)
MDTTINQFAEAIIRAGVGAPCYVGVGLVLIETKGRKSGLPRSVPVLAQRVGNRLFVSTIRKNSQWVKNLVADPAPRVVLHRKSRSVTVQSNNVGNWTLLQLDLI